MRALLSTIYDEGTEDQYKSIVERLICVLLSIDSDNTVHNEVTEDQYKSIVGRLRRDAFKLLFNEGIIVGWTASEQLGRLSRTR